MLATDRPQLVASVLVSKLWSFTEFHLLSPVELGRTSPLSPTAFRGLTRLLCLVLVLCYQPSIAHWSHHVSKALPHLRNAFTHHQCFRFCPVPLRLHRSGPEPSDPLAPELGSPIGAEPQYDWFLLSLTHVLLLALLGVLSYCLCSASCPWLSHHPDFQ